MLAPSFFVIYFRQHNEDVRTFTMHGIWRQRQVVCYKRIHLRVIPMGMLHMKTVPYKSPQRHIGENMNTNRIVRNSNVRKNIRFYQALLWSVEFQNFINFIKHISLSSWSQKPGSFRQVYLAACCLVEFKTTETLGQMHIPNFLFVKKSCI